LSPTPPSTFAPTGSPKRSHPSKSPSPKPSFAPTTVKPTHSPTHSPVTKAPSRSPTDTPTTSPSRLPTASPTNQPTASPSLGLHPDDQAAWSIIRTALQSDYWWDCGGPGSACEACQVPDVTHYIKCDTIAVRSSTGVLLRHEVRITEIVLPSIGAWGEAPVQAFNVFPNLLFLNFETLPDTEYINVITLPPGMTCARIIACDDPSLPCSLGGDSTPICNADGLPILSTGVPTPVNTSILIGLACGVLAMFVLAFLVALCLLWRAEFDRRLRREKRRDERSGGAHATSDTAKATTRALLNQAGLTSLASSNMLKSSASLRSLKRRRSMKARAARATTGNGRYTVENASANQWSQSFDYQSGATYWINNVTGAFSWTPPAGSAPQPPPQQHQPMPMMMASPSSRSVGSSHSFRAPPPPVPGMPPPGPPPVQRAPSMAMAQPVYQSMRVNQSASMAFGALGAAPGGFGAPSGADMSYAQAPMPQDMWEEIYDSATDSSYWVNSSTGQFSYKDPHSRR